MPDPSSLPGLAPDSTVQKRIAMYLNHTSELPYPV